VKDGERSLMAERVAITRALHQVVDHEPLVFRDPLAVQVIGPENESWMRQNMEWQQREPLRRVRAMVCIRARFTEDELLDAIVGGTAQYVVLGAGLDTFACRRPDLAARLRVFEVDHPDTQAWKRERLASAGVSVPPHLCFVPVDFNTQSLAERLAAAGFRREEPAFFSWLGVTYYLPRESVTQTLRYVGEHPARVQVVFDFAVSDAELPQESKDVWSRVNAFTAQVGEPWQTTYSPSALAAELRELGLSDVFHLTAEVAGERYLKDRRDLPGLGPFVGVMSAGH
jgi:methyltransferase (TIGR00027 family)